MLYPHKVKLVCPDITNSLNKLSFLRKNQLDTVHEINGQEKHKNMMWDKFVTKKMILIN